MDAALFAPGSEEENNTMAGLSALYSRVTAQPDWNVASTACTQKTLQTPNTSADDIGRSTGAAPGLAVAATPLVLNLGFTFVVIPAMDIDFLALPEFGETDLSALRGVWSIIAALALVAMNWRRLVEGLSKTLEDASPFSTRQAYTDIALVAVLIPILALVVMIVLGALLGSF